MNVDEIIDKRITFYMPPPLRQQVKYTIISVLAKPDIKHHMEIFMPVEKFECINEKEEYSIPVEKFECHTGDDTSPVFETEICKLVSNYTGEIVYPEQLYSSSKLREVVLARQMCMVYRLQKKINKSLQKAADPYGKDHATVIHAKKSIRNLLDTDKRFIQMVDKVKYEIKYDYSDI